MGISPSPGSALRSTMSISLVFIVTGARRGAIVAGMPQPPALTPEQRQAALAKAAKVRRERADVKVKARRLMDTVGISESRRIQGLGSNQRQSLLRETAR